LGAVKKNHWSIPRTVSCLSNIQKVKHLDKSVLDLQRLAQRWFQVDEHKSWMMRTSSFLFEAPDKVRLVLRQFRPRQLTIPFALERSIWVYFRAQFNVRLLDKLLQPFNGLLVLRPGNAAKPDD
jgi:hypothetical protein